MLVIPSLVLIVSFLTQATVLAVPVPLNNACIPSCDNEANKILVTRGPPSGAGSQLAAKTKADNKARLEAKAKADKAAAKATAKNPKAPPYPGSGPPPPYYE